ncbi:XdhC family protein [Neoroseomonas marina]|nr:XdhC family protein [Neoroseomonas marina]
MPEEARLAELMAAMARRREPHALAMVVETRGSTSAHAGDRALIDAAGTVLLGWVGGGCAEGAVRQAALDGLEDGTPRLIELDLDDEVLGVGMPCGGTMRVFVAPVLPPPTLWIVGHGRVAESLCRIGAELGFRIVVSDVPAPEPDRFPGAEEIIGDDYDFARLQPGRDDSVVIATQHKGDHLSAVRALRSSAGHVAIIASRKRAALMRDFLRDEGFGPAALARLRAPAGLDLGAQAPAEIALSVLAEIVMRRRGGTGTPRDAGASERPAWAEATP